MQDFENVTMAIFPSPEAYGHRPNHEEAIYSKELRPVTSVYQLD
jgi:hypothetical protein